MVSPQLENGYTRIADELLEALALCKLGEYERAVIDVIIRKTYGFNKKVDWIANSQFVEATGIRKQHCWRTVNDLVSKQVVTRRGNKIGINKHYCQWQVTWRGYSSNLERLQKLPPEELQKTKDILNTLGEKISPGKKTLKDNQEEMNWNKPNDNDSDLPEIDMDSREEIKPAPFKKKTQSRVSPEVRMIFDLFGNGCFERLYIRKQEKEAAEYLVKEHKIIELKKAVSYFEENKDQDFIPQIHSPYDLRMKWHKLKAHKEKHG